MANYFSALSQIIFEKYEFTSEEIQLFEKRYENGYDLTHDTQYNKWKDLHEAGNLKLSLALS